MVLFRYHGKSKVKLKEIRDRHPVVEKDLQAGATFHRIGILICKFLINNGLDRKILTKVFWLQAYCFVAQKLKILTIGL